MRRAFVITVAFAILAALAYGGAWLWMRRPWRVIASVDGDTLTSHDLDIRVKTYYGDQTVTEEVRREIVQAWIAKQVLLGEAVRRSVSLTKNDEDEVNAILAAWFASQGTTVERFFAEGPLPEERKRKDFKEGMLVHALVKEGLRTASFQDFYRSMREKAVVRCPEFPKLERADARVPLYVGFWGWRPLRVSAAAAGQVLTSAELDLRMRTQQVDHRRRGQMPLPVQVLRDHEVDVWIYKVVMSTEALRRGIKVTPDDEKKERLKLIPLLETHKLTVDQFFKEGVLPESLKLEDFRSNIRVNKLLAREVEGKDNVSGAEIEARMAELRRRAEDEAARGLKPTIRSDRKSAINDLRGERLDRKSDALFRTLFDSARVWSPEFPKKELVDGVSIPLMGGRR